MVCSCGTCEKSGKESVGFERKGKQSGSSRGCGDEEENYVGPASKAKQSRFGGVGGNNGSGDCDTDDDSETSGDEKSEDDSGSEDSSSEDEMDIKCSGSAYATRHPLECELHSLLYEIECDRVAKKAKDVIHNEMGRGHSNLPESKFHVLTRFRPKNVNLHQVHYEFSTNSGLCQGNMTCMFHERGPRYHWMRELLELSGLPIPDLIEDVWEEENLRRMRNLERQQTKEVKTARAKRKQKRSQESKKRFLYIFFYQVGLWGQLFLFVRVSFGGVI